MSQIDPIHRLEESIAQIDRYIETVQPQEDIVDELLNAQGAIRRVRDHEAGGGA